MFMFLPDVKQARIVLNTRDDVVIFIENARVRIARVIIARATKSLNSGNVIIMGTRQVSNVLNVLTFVGC